MLVVPVAAKSCMQYFKFSLPQSDPYMENTVNFDPQAGMPTKLPVHKIPE